MKINVRNIIFAIVIIVCIFAINFAIFWGVFRKPVGEQNTIDNTITQESSDELAKDFKNIFKSTLDYQGYDINTAGVSKKDSTKDFIYTLVEKKEVIENRYDIAIKIPYVNLVNTSVEKFNEKIESLFVNKAKDIMTKATNNTIYTVDYQAYVNTNILSLVIRSTLKEGNNPQRVIIQTYNYNLSTNEEITLGQVLEIKNLKKQAVKNQIINKIEEANQEAESLQRLGYSVYIRDPQSEMYNIEDNTNYILGKNSRLYFIYPYGNQNFTDEVDVIVF